MESSIEKTFGLINGEIMTVSMCRTGKARKIIFNITRPLKRSSLRFKYGDPMVPIHLWRLMRGKKTQPIIFGCNHK
jgi:hypothetical protein